MLASVIIVEYRTRQFLPDCLRAIERSLLARDLFEVIVVDNASPTPAADLARVFPRVRFLTSGRNLGFAGGNALGLEHARGKHIALLNPDAIPAPGWLGAVLAPLAQPRVGVVGSKLLHPGTDLLQHTGGELQPNGLSRHFGRGERDLGQWDVLRDVDYVCGAAFALAREVIDSVGFLSPAYYPAYYEETELCVRARKAGFRVVYAPGAVCWHHEAAASGNVTSDGYLRRFHESRLRFVLRNYSKAELATRFVPSELAWLYRHCPPKERRICARAYVEAWRTAFDSSRGTPAPGDVISDSFRGGAE